MNSYLKIVFSLNQNRHFLFPLKILSFLPSFFVNYHRELFCVSCSTSQINSCLQMINDQLFSALNPS
eukprot:UN24275